MSMIRFPVLLGGLLLTASALAQTCAAPGPVSARGEALARIALDEYQRFNGHRIDAQGRLWKFGSVETETEPLLDVQTGAVDEAAPERFAWRRVWRYWQALDQHVPGTTQNRRVRWAPGLLEGAEPAGANRLTTLEQAFAQVSGPDAALLREALVRAAISDTPWSAAFISFLMQQGGLGEQEFRYSSAHAVYIRPALEDAPGYAYRACEPRQTRPRVGDLLCYSRGATAMRSLQDWRVQAGRLNGSVKSHCDLVVSVDQAARKIETIGGNVLQSVARRKLLLNERGVLSDRHQAALQRPRPGSECARDPSCQKGDLNLQHWGVLLQLR